MPGLYDKKSAILFAAATEFVKGCQADVGERATVGGDAVIAQDYLEHVGVVTYLWAIFESAGAGAAACIIAKTDLGTEKELFAGIVTGADDDGNMADSGGFVAVASNIDRLTEEVGIARGGNTGDLLGEGVFALDLTTNAKGVGVIEVAGRKAKVDTGAEMEITLGHLRF